MSYCLYLKINIPLGPHSPLYLLFHFFDLCPEESYLHLLSVLLSVTALSLTFHSPRAQVGLWSLCVRELALSEVTGGQSSFTVVLTVLALVASDAVDLVALLSSLRWHCLSWFCLFFVAHSQSPMLVPPFPSSPSCGKVPQLRIWSPFLSPFATPWGSHSVSWPI